MAKATRDEIRQMHKLLLGQPERRFTGPLAKKIACGERLIGNTGARGAGKQRFYCNKYSNSLGLIPGPCMPP